LSCLPADFGKSGLVEFACDGLAKPPFEKRNVILSCHLQALPRAPSNPASCVSAWPKKSGFETSDVLATDRTTAFESGEQTAEVYLPMECSDNGEYTRREGPEPTPCADATSSVFVLTGGGGFSSRRNAMVRSLQLTSPNDRRLRPDFVWGVSTSSYQIEGAAREDGRGASIWDTYCLQAGRIKNGDTGEVACDHYHRFADDVSLMRDLGVSAYRFSIAWPRVLPHGRGAANEKGLDFYERLIDTVMAAGIEPWLCLYHWDLPQDLDDLGGWTRRDCAGWFADYAALVATRYGDRVKRFATFNEPSVFTLFGYGMGGQAPGIIARTAYLKAIHHVNLAHGAGVDVLRALVPAASIGAIHNRQPCLPVRDTPEDRAAAEMLDAYWNGAFPDPQLRACYPLALAPLVEPYAEGGDLARICRRVDWFGLNHYSPNYAKADPTAPLGFAFGDAPEEIGRTGTGWPIHPDAFRQSLLEINNVYRLPIYVLENGYGAADVVDEAGEVHDQPRIDYLAAYTAVMRAAITAGADVRGYFVWSLLDNFEWGSGYTQRFGLVYVDYQSQRRIPKASARWYADLIAAMRKSANLQPSPGNSKA
jgi:beta-glucosidase